MSPVLYASRRVEVTTEHVRLKSRTYGMDLIRGAEVGAPLTNWKEEWWRCLAVYWYWVAFLCLAFGVGFAFFVYENKTPAPEVRVATPVISPAYSIDLDFKDRLRLALEAVQEETRIENERRAKYLASLTWVDSVPTAGAAGVGATLAVLAFLLGLTYSWKARYRRLLVLRTTLGLQTVSLPLHEAENALRAIQAAKPELLDAQKEKFPAAPSKGC